MNFSPTLWLTALASYKDSRVVGMLFLGFSAGLPFILVLGTLSRWLSEAGISRATIGFFSWIGLAYAFKFCWAPLVDRLPIPFLSRYLGRRRAWLLLSQLAIMLALIGMATTDPQINLHTMAQLALLVAFSSATQDIALDAYRIEAVPVEMQGVMSASYMTGYRLAMIIASAGAFFLADWASLGDGLSYDYSAWKFAYLCMAAFMLVGISMTLIIKEPKLRVDELSQQRKAKLEAAVYARCPGWSGQAIAWFSDAVISPFWDFLQRHGWRALWILGLIATYRISDVVLGVMANPFYNEMLYTKTEVASITKIYGVLMTIIGVGVGGVLMVRKGVMPILLLGAILSAGSNLFFSYLAGVGHDLVSLTLLISFDNFSAGIATAAFVAYLSGLTNVAYSATQYALFSSIMLLFPKFIAGFSGVLVDQMGYANFFIFTACLGGPVLILIVLLMRLAPVGNNS